MAGIFITFEGTEGCGKSTHIHKLTERLQAEGHAVRVVREPGGTESGEQIRKLLKHGPKNLTAESRAFTDERQPRTARAGGHPARVGGMARWCCAIAFMIPPRFIRARVAGSMPRKCSRSSTLPWAKHGRI